MRALLARLPQLLGAATLLLPALLLLLDLARPGTVTLPFRLDGVTAAQRPVPSLAALLDGTYQAQAARAVGAMSPVYPLAVRLRGELAYRLFHTSSIPWITVGRGRTLIETGYIEEYCSRDLARFRAQAAAWLPQLKAVQDGLERRGQQFVYVITPSKVAHDPALLPAGLRCPAPEADRTGLLPLWRGMLDGAGIHYVDTAAVLAAAQPHFPLPLFARGGTHWTLVGAALAGQALVAALDAGRQDGVFAPFGFTWRPAPRPVYPDNDLALLMNLLWPDESYATPAIAYRNAAPATPCHPVRVAIVGGSFMNHLGAVLAQGPCHPDVQEWEYWTANHVTWPQPPGDSLYAAGPIDPAARDRQVLGADVVIYEENEQLVARTRHGPLLYAFLRAQPGWLDPR